MKRSHMLLKIQEMLVEINPEDVQMAADELLARIEKVGMLPPVVEGVVKVETEGDQLIVRPWRWEDETYCIDCGVETIPGKSSARCRECWDDKNGV